MTRIHRIALVCIGALLAGGSVEASIRHLERDEVTGHIGSTREEVYARRERRKGQFGGKLDELKQQWEDHESGIMRLNPVAADKLLKKIKAYEQKIDYLHKTDDDRHINRLLDREALRNEVHRERILRRSEL